MLERPNMDKIEKTAQIVNPDWIPTLQIMVQKEELSLYELRQAGLKDWMEGELRHGKFAGWHSEDLRTLINLLFKQGEES